MFQFNSRLFFLLIVRRGSKKRSNNIIIDTIRKSIMGIIFLIDIILKKEKMIITRDIINRSQKRFPGFEKSKFKLD